MNKLFIYYSHSGNGDLIADILKQKGYDIIKIIPKHRLPKNFFLSMMVGGFLAGIKHKSKLNNINVDFSQYQKIVIGSPIWNDNFACPINTLLDQVKLDDRYSFILYSGGGETKTATKRINNLGNYQIINIKEPKKNENLNEQLDNL